MMDISAFLRGLALASVVVSLTGLSLVALLASFLGRPQRPTQAAKDRSGVNEVRR